MNKKVNNQPSGNVELALIATDDYSLQFKFRNGLPSPLFMAYSKEQYDDETSVFVPYNLQCKTQKNGMFQAAGPEFLHVPELSQFESNRTIIFKIDKPTIQGICLISIGYYEDAEAAHLVIEKNADHLSKFEQEFIDKSMRSVTLEFTLK